VENSSDLNHEGHEEHEGRGAAPFYKKIPFVSFVSFVVKKFNEEVI